MVRRHSSSRMRDGGDPPPDSELQTVKPEAPGFRAQDIYPLQDDIERKERKNMYYSDSRDKGSPRHHHSRSKSRSGTSEERRSPPAETSGRQGRSERGSSAVESSAGRESHSERWNYAAESSAGRESHKERKGYAAESVAGYSGWSEKRNLVIESPASRASRGHNRESLTVDKQPASTIASPRSQMSPQSGLSSPREGKKTQSRRERLKKAYEIRRNSPATRPSEGRSLSPRQSSKQEPLLTDEKNNSNSNDETCRLTAKKAMLKLRVVDDSEEEVPVYRPPVIADQDSGETSSTKFDKYEMELTQQKTEKVQKNERQNSMTESLAPVASGMSSYYNGRRDDTSAYDTVGPVMSGFTNDNIESRQMQSQNERMRVQDDRGNTDDVLNSPRKVPNNYSFRDVDSGRFIDSGSEEIFSASEDEGIIIVKQRVAYLCIILTAVQLAMLFIQLALCGFASLDINPMIGPYPDAFSEWGGKNTYLMVEERQYFRIITPVLLHVGFFHLLINSYCQLETCAYFEREWGSCRWLTIYLISGVGSVLAACAVDPDLIGVSSSGALMGMIGAKIAQVITWSCFELRNSLLKQSTRLDQLSGVMCSAAMISLLSFFTYIDFSGHIGGFVSGFLAGIMIFSKPIASRRSRALWASTGFLGMVVGGSILIIMLLRTEADEELGDACQYFRNLFPEGYNCDCVWD